MGHRNSGIGRNGNGGGYAGNHLKGDPVFCQKQQFFTAAAKQEGVAALETDDPFAFLRFF